MTKKLIVHPTSRRLRALQNEFRVGGNKILPTLMLTNEFESRCIVINDRFQVDSMERILLLREAASFEAFEELKLNLDLVKFFTRSDAIFKFYEELAREGVEIRELSSADTYAEFDEHLEILELLRDRYIGLLEQRGLTDNALVPKIYQINNGFISNFDSIEIHIEGLLSRYEFELLDKVASITPTTIYFQTSKFTKKMQDRFVEYGIELPDNTSVIIDFTNKKIVNITDNEIPLTTNIISTTQRFEQIAIAFEQIEYMIQDGINPENIALILPDESFKDSVNLYDKQNNLNFAMGDSYTKTKTYKTLQAIQNYIKEKNEINKTRLQLYKVDIDTIEKYITKDIISIETFFADIDALMLLDAPLDKSVKIENYHSQAIYEKYIHMSRIFNEHILYFADWLTIWLNAISEITIDDTKGGKITVMGALETRGAQFDGVVVIDFNDGITPALPSKDMFLNSSVRALASLPTVRDREDLQKQLYKRVLEQSKSSVVIYSTSDNKLPSKFIYELGIGRYKQDNGDMKLLYNAHTIHNEPADEIVKDFDATKIIWSSTKLKTYLTCKRKYYYQYVLKMRPSDDSETPNDGTLLHRLFENIFAKKPYYDNNYDFKKDISMELDRLLPYKTSEIKYKKLLWQSELTPFVKNQLIHFSKDWRVARLEFEIDGEICGLKFTGKVDRLDQNSVSTLVLDYKSGNINNKATNLEDESDFQMSIYNHLLKQKYKNLSFGFLPFFDNQKSQGGIVEEVKELETKNEYLAAHIERLKVTKEFTASKCENLKSCTYCDYKLLCGRGEYL